ncbi:lactonase family protein, partial [Paenibacillus sepulcri]|nr:lactonase family protein [Paenibacillus sepulcri]
IFSPDGRFLFVQDLGLDRISSYVLEEDAGRLVLHEETSLHPGAGPRHFAFRPDGKYAYVINEVDSTITGFAYDAEKGRLTSIETVPTLPDGFQGENTCAEIAVSEDGRFLYGSNRGHDSIVVYAIDEESGRLTLVEHADV